MSTNALNQLEQQLERSIENVRQIKIIVSDFQPQGQPGLNQVSNRLNTISLVPNEISSRICEYFLIHYSMFSETSNCCKRPSRN